MFVALTLHFSFHHTHTTFAIAPDIVHLRMWTQEQLDYLWDQHDLGESLTDIAKVGLRRSRQDLAVVDFSLASQKNPECGQKAVEQGK